MESGKIHKDITDTKKSNLAKYRELYLGNLSIFGVIGFELITTALCNLPGALGLFLRKIFYKILFKRVGRNVIFGRGITIRHPKKISIGDNVVIEDNCVLDAKGKHNKGIEIGDGVIISRNVILSCKNGHIKIGTNSVVGINSVIHSVDSSSVYIGEDGLISAFCYLIGSGNYNFNRQDIPIREQGLISKGGINIKNNVWLGASVNVADGVSIEEGCIIGAYSFVNKSIAEKNSISYGVPAKVVGKRF